MNEHQISRKQYGLRIFCIHWVWITHKLPLWLAIVNQRFRNFVLMIFLFFLRITPFIIYIYIYHMIYLQWSQSQMLAPLLSNPRPIFIAINLGSFSYIPPKTFNFSLWCFFFFFYGLDLMEFGQQKWATHWRASHNGNTLTFLLMYTLRLSLARYLCLESANSSSSINHISWTEDDNNTLGYKAE